MSDTPRINTFNKVHFGCLLLIAIIFPLHKVLTSVPFAVMVLNWLLRGQWSDKWAKLKNTKTVWWNIAYYALLVIGLLYTENLAVGLAGLKVKISILLLPLVMATSPALNKKQFRYVLLAFVLSCSVSIVWAYIYAAMQHLDGLRGAFYYQKLMKYTNIHPTYQAMNMLMALTIVFISATGGQKLWGEANNQWWKYTAVMIHLMVFILLLAARMELIVLFLLVLWWALQYAIRGRSIKHYAILALLLVGIPAAVWFIPGTHNRIVTVAVNVQKSMSDPDHAFPLNGRIQLWSAGWNAATDNLPLGVGTGDSRAELLAEMERNGELPDQKIIGSINLHNEYLQHFLALGIPGVIGLLGMLFFPLFRKLSEGNALYRSFVFIFALSIIAETMLATQSGVMFFSYFSSLLLYARPKPSE